MLILNYVSTFACYPLFIFMTYVNIQQPPLDNLHIFHPSLILIPSQSLTLQHRISHYLCLSSTQDCLPINFTSTLSNFDHLQFTAYSKNLITASQYLSDGNTNNTL